MPEVVSSTTSFNLPIDEIIEDAFEMVDGPLTSGYDARSARRSLNLLLIDLSNRNYPLGYLEQRTISLTAGTTTYNLGADVLAIVDLNLKEVDGGNEQQLIRMSPLDYFNITDKAQTGRPSIYSFDRTGASPPRLILWPSPEDDGVYQAVFWVVRRHKDITKSYELLDLSHRYLPAITVGLAYFIGLKRPSFDQMRLDRLKGEYEERLQRALDEDSDKNDFIVYPDIRR